MNIIFNYIYFDDLSIPAEFLTEVLFGSAYLVVESLFAEVQRLIALELKPGLFVQLYSVCCDLNAS